MNESPFALENLHAWCIVPFDAAQRTPRQRCEMLRQLGIRHLAYDWRQKNVEEFDEEFSTCQEFGINLRAVWTVSDVIVDAVKRHGLKLAFWQNWHSDWLTNFSDGMTQIRRMAQVALGAEGTLGLYDHGAFDPDRTAQMLEMIEAADLPNVRLVFNFHHWTHLDQTESFLRQTLPYLDTINLSGKNRGDTEKAILPFGQGDCDREILRILKDLDFQGHYGLIGHQHQRDVMEVLTTNIAALESLLAE